MYVFGLLMIFVSFRMTSSNNNSASPSLIPSPFPTLKPSMVPSSLPTIRPTTTPTSLPTFVPTMYDVRVMSESGSCESQNCAAISVFNLVDFQLDDAWESIFLTVDGLKGDLASSGVEYVSVYAGGIDTGIKCSTSVDCGGSAGMTNGLGDTCVEYLNVSQYAPRGAARGSNDQLAARLLFEIELRASFGVNACSPFVAGTMTLYIEFDPSSFAPTNTPIPTPTPTNFPTLSPTILPTSNPSLFPTPIPTLVPISEPSYVPSNQPSQILTSQPTLTPLSSPTMYESSSSCGKCGCSGCSIVVKVIIAVFLSSIGFCVFFCYYRFLKSNARRRRREDINSDNTNEVSWLRRPFATIERCFVDDEYLIDIPVVEFRRTRRYRAAVVAARVLRRKIKSSSSSIERAESGQSNSSFKPKTTPFTTVDINVGGVNLGAVVMEKMDTSDWVEGDDRPLSSVTSSSVVVSSLNKETNHLEEQNEENSTSVLDKTDVHDNLGDIVLDRLCSICLADIEHRDLAKELNCFHFYHADCLDSWLQVSTTCPLCKQQAVPPPRLFFSSMYVSIVLAYDDFVLWLKQLDCTYILHGCCRSSGHRDESDDKSSSNIEMTHKTHSEDVSIISDKGKEGYVQEDHHEVISSLGERARVARALRQSQAMVRSKLDISKSMEYEARHSFRKTHQSSFCVEEDEESDGESNKSDSDISTEVVGNGDIVDSQQPINEQQIQQVNSSLVLNNVETNEDGWADLVDSEDDWGEELGADQWDVSDGEEAVSEVVDVVSVEEPVSNIVKTSRNVPPKAKRSFGKVAEKEDENSSEKPINDHRKHFEKFSKSNGQEQGRFDSEADSLESTSESRDISGGDDDISSEHSGKSGRSSDDSLSSLDDSVSSAESEEESDIHEKEWDQDEDGGNMSFAANFNLISKDFQDLVTSGELTLLEATRLSRFNNLEVQSSPQEAAAIALTIHESLQGHEEDVEGNGEGFSSPSSFQSNLSRDEALAENEQIIEDFEHEKQKAVEREDYSRAEELRLEINALKRSGNSDDIFDQPDLPSSSAVSEPTTDSDILDNLLLDLEDEKRKAVALNDFKRADELRSEIREIKAEKRRLSMDS